MSKYAQGYASSQFQSTSVGKSNAQMDIKKKLFFILYKIQEIKRVLDHEAEENIRIDGLKPSRELHKQKDNDVEDDYELVKSMGYSKPK